MTLLAIDTSANLCACALYDSAYASVIATKCEDIGRGHAERLMGLLQELLEEAGKTYDNVERVAVTTGPGSFTGIRVGIAAARGLALGLEIPVIGISVLEAIAFQHRRAFSELPVFVAMDARREEVFLQVFRGDQNTPPKNVPVAEVLAHLPSGPFALAGSASSIIADKLGRNDIQVISSQTAADIAAVAELALQHPNWHEKPKPLYLRKADAKPQLNFAVPHADSQQQVGRV